MEYELWFTVLVAKSIQIREWCGKTACAEVVPSSFVLDPKFFRNSHETLLPITGGFTRGGGGDKGGRGNGGNGD